jgi:hypothetical protein
MIKSWGEMASWGDKKCFQYFSLRDEGKRALGRPQQRWGILLKWILKRTYTKDSTGLGQETVYVCYEHGNETLS